MAATKADSINGASRVGPLQVAKLQLLAAEWKLLNASQPTIVPSPGPGRALLLERAYLTIFAKGATAGNTDANLSIRYTSGTGDDQSQAQDDFLNDATTEGQTMTIERIGTETATQTLGYLKENKGLELYSASDLSASAGTFAIEVTVFYRVIKMAEG